MIANDHYIRIEQILLYSLCITAAACNSRSPGTGDSNFDYTLPYRLETPDTVFVLPSELREISGLSMSPDGKSLLALNDEEGVVYYLDPATGAVQIVRYSSVNDVGRVVNPMIVVGQLDGGAIQGIGQALHEQVVYDRETGQLVTGSLMDYGAPRADDMACDFVTEMDQSTPCKNNPLGVKGVGELGTIGATPSVVNAVADALARAGRADLTPGLQMPLTAARLWARLQG